ncbi:hypothetical protein PR048_016766 [Dryococelus australis]|uniref:Uncharacterized protein n=1 Tax=Dryococelus australis TaxID=614101 RepID=A0ABQ9H7V5_9NEOP|nr:hypothetical protein PR048_016766 [Dryococelus australis]
MCYSVLGNPFFFFFSKLFHARPIISKCADWIYVKLRYNLALNFALDFPSVKLYSHRLKSYRKKNLFEKKTCVQVQCFTHSGDAALDVRASVAHSVRSFLCHVASARNILVGNIRDYYRDLQRTLVHTFHQSYDRSHRHPQHNKNTARQFSALRVGAKGHQAHVSVSSLWRRSPEPLRSLHSLCARRRWPSLERPGATSRAAGRRSRQHRTVGSARREDAGNSLRRVAAQIERIRTFRKPGRVAASGHSPERCHRIGAATNTEGDNPDLLASRDQRSQRECGVTVIAGSRRGAVPRIWIGRNGWLIEGMEGGGTADYSEPRIRDEAVRAVSRGSQRESPFSKQRRGLFIVAREGYRQTPNYSRAKKLLEIDMLDPLRGRLSGGAFKRRLPVRGWGGDICSGAVDLEIGEARPPRRPRLTVDQLAVSNESKALSIAAIDPQTQLQPSPSAKVGIRACRLALYRDSLRQWDMLGTHMPPPTCSRGHTGLDSRRGVAPGFSHAGIVLDDAAGRRVFLGISRFPSPLHSGTALYSRPFTLIGSQDNDLNSRPHFFTLQHLIAFQA